MASFKFYIYSNDVLAYNRSTGQFDFDADYDHAEDRYLIVVEDDDSTMNAYGDSNQIAIVYDMDGNAIDKGLVEVPMYATIGHSDGHSSYLDRVEVNGTHYGYSPSELLEPGESYSVWNSGTFEESHEYYEKHSVPCLAPGTCVATPHGAIPIEEIRAGDLICTLDHGPQPVLWAGGYRAAPLGARPPHSAWSVTLPPRDGASKGVTLSALHRVLIHHPAFQLAIGASEVLAQSDFLFAPTTPTLWDPPLVWHHLLLPRHELISCEGYWVESLFAGGSQFAALPSPIQTAVRAALATTPSADHRSLARPSIRRYELATAEDWSASDHPVPSGMTPSQAA